MSKRANRRNRRKQTSVQKQQPKQVEMTTAIPHITGAEFPETDDISRFEEMIAKAPRSGQKRRILWISEASYLCTGFSTYLREVFKRLHKSGKYELAEFGSYGEAPHIDSRAKQIPWKYYHNLPTTEAEGHQYGMLNGQVVGPQYQENQFGKWRLPYVLADFRPDIVISIRDHWMDTYVEKVPFRDKFVWFWMPTVDGYPQKWDWIQSYGRVDYLMAYSHFGRRVLEEQSHCVLSKLLNMPQLKVREVCQPGVDLEIFKPMDRGEVRKVFGIPYDPAVRNTSKEIRFVGTVMRNQPRKLFPRIIETFRRFRRDYPAESENVMLLLHTSVPDVGWDLPRVVAENGLQRQVLYTYHCMKCGNLGISSYIGSPTACPVCKTANSFINPNTKYGLSPEHLALIYNLMDVYIQGSIAEGDGMPVNEAKACGIPCLMSDFSALAEKARNGGALPITNDALYTEHETHQWRSLFDRNDLAKKLALLMGNENKRRQLSHEARICAERFYSWELTAKKWEAYFDSIPIKDRKKTWDAPVELKEMSSDPAPEGLSNEEFLEWCYKNILGRNGVDKDGKKYWGRALEQGASRKEMEGHFRKIIESENAAKRLLLGQDSVSFDNPKDKILEKIREVEREV